MPMPVSYTHLDVYKRQILYSLGYQIERYGTIWVSQCPWVHFQWVKSGRCFSMRLQTQVAPEIQKRLLLSRVEAESLKERDIFCPTCGFRIQRVFSDTTGHLSVKCQKCKNVHILNLAYFRRIRRNGYGRNCRRWRLQVNIETISNRVSGDKQFIC